MVDIDFMAFIQSLFMMGAMIMVGMGLWELANRIKIKRIDRYVLAAGGRAGIARSDVEFRATFALGEFPG